MVTLEEEVEVWTVATNDKQKGVDWQFIINDARHEPKSVHSKIKC